MPPKKQDDMLLILERKFDELKSQFISEFRVKIQEIVQEDFSKIADKYEQRSTILESNVEMLKQHINVLKQLNDKLITSIDDLEQYGRRQSLRVYGVPQEDDETSESVVNKVHQIMKDIECDIPINFIDRAHRVGKKRQDIIVKFCSFRYRSQVYRARKKCKDVRIGLDLTATKYTLFKDARNRVEHNPKVKFVYADLNCNLKVRPVVGTEKGFCSLDELSIILSSL